MNKMQILASMRMHEAKTHRNLDVINFVDDNQRQCSIQESSVATENMIWIGRDDDRMHLTQE